MGWPFPRREASLLWEWVDYCEQSAIDSIWLADRVVAPTLSLESMTFMGALAARTQRMKFGNSVLALPLRNPVVLAKEIATVDFISNGRMLPAVGIGTDNPAEFEATGTDIKERAGRTDEAMVLMRRLWTENEVTFHGKYYKTTKVTIEPKPVQKPAPPIWIGGRTEAAFRRAGRYGDGWMASTVTPAEAGKGIEAIRRYAKEAGRVVPDDHYGVIVSYYFAKSREEAERTAAQYGIGARARPEVPVTSLSGLGTGADISALIADYVKNGVSKFVMRAACPPEQTMEQTRRLAEEVAPYWHKR
jgi:probable F420-dependent oxidoreductase